MYPQLRLKNETLPALQMRRIFNTLEERLNVLSTGMGDIKETQVKLMEMKMIMSEAKINK